MGDSDYFLCAEPAGIDILHKPLGNNQKQKKKKSVCTEKFNKNLSILLQKFRSQNKRAREEQRNKWNTKQPENNELNGSI